MLGVAVLALLFIGTMAVTRAPRTSAAKGKITTNVKNNFTNAGLNLARAVPLPTPSWDPIFEVEGNAYDDSGPGLPEDWSDLNNNPIPVGTSGSVTGAAGSSLASVFVSDPPIRTDLIYTGGGSKDFNQISDWGQVARGTGPSKDDVEHAFAAKYLNSVDGHTVLVFGGDRPTNNGDANIGFWFFQNPVGPNSSGGFSSLHRNGDVFVLSAFSGGGGTSSIRTLVWVGQPYTAGPGGTDSGALARCNVLVGVIDPKSDTTAFPQGSLCDISGSHPNAGTGITNTGDVHISWQYTNKDTKVTCTTPDQTATSPCVIPTPDFFEGAIDITSLGFASECFASFLLETRSSAEVSAVLKDFALGNFQSCSGTCNKTASPTTVCEDPAHPGQGLPVTLTYETKNTGGSALNETLKDDNGTPANTADDFYITGGLTVAPAAPGTCTTGSSSVTIPVAAGQTLRCTLSVAEAVGTTTDTLTVHEVNSLVIDCTQTAQVTVNPLPAANPASLSLCETVAGGGTATFDLTSVEGTVKGAGATGVTVTWFTDADLALAHQINNPATYTSASATVYAKVTNDTTGCFSSAAVTLTVLPRPSVDQPGDQTVCNGASTSAITFTGSAGATFNWVNDNTGIGLGASGTGSIAAFTATNSGTTNAVANITVTPTGANGCVGPSKSFKITVKPTPSVNQPADQLLCDGATTSAVNFTSVVAGTSFGWTNDTPSIGLAASGSGNIAAFTATNAGTSNVVATITVTPTANGCAGPSKHFTITVKPTPTVEICPTAADANSCTTDEDILLEAAVSPAGGVVTYSWTKVGNATVLGTGSTLLVTAPGTYRVDITRDGCSAFNTTHVGLCAGCSP